MHVMQLTPLEEMTVDDLISKGFNTCYEVCVTGIGT